MVACPCQQALLGIVGCRRTLWEICTGLWSRPVWLLQLTTDQPAAWSTSARLSVESTTPCSATSFTACESSTAHLRYASMSWASTPLHYVCCCFCLLIDTLASLQNVPLQDTHRSLGFLGWGCGFKLLHTPSACASHSRHLPPGDKRHLNPSFTRSALCFLSALLQHRSPCRSKDTPAPPHRGSLSSDSCYEMTKKRV